MPQKWAPWPPRTRPFEDTPQRPYTGKTLPYFKAEEGLRALAESPMLQSTRGNLMGRTLPPPLQVRQRRHGLNPHSSGQCRIFLTTNPGL